MSHWDWQPLALAAAVALALWYVRSVRAVRRSGRRWPAGRTAVFGTGVVLGVWATCGFPQAYAGSLFWMWTAQQLGLLLVVPLVVLAGAPVQLARAVSGERSLAHRLLRSRTMRTLANPLVGPALVPILSVVLFFGPVPGWSVGVAPVGWVEQLLVLAAGTLIVLPLVGVENSRSSLAVGLSMAIGSVELVIDLAPGLALRLHDSLSTSYFDHRTLHPWSPGALHDQHIGGTVLWCVAALIDLPFLVLVFRQWMRADERDAADVDAVLEAERIARGVEQRAGGRDPDAPEPDDRGPRDVPWWLTDPAMRDRLDRPS